MKNKFLYRVYLATRWFDSIFFIRLRSFLFNRILNLDKRNLIIRSDVRIYGFNYLLYGNDVSINHGCFISCEGGLIIGDYVSIGHNTSIITTSHSYEDPCIPIKYQEIKLDPVEIGNNVWIGANVTILSGVKIADGVIVAAGALVNKSISEEDVIIAGVPARIVKKRFHDKDKK